MALEFAIGDSAFCVVVDGTSVSLQRKCVGADGQILKNERGEAKRNLKFFLSIPQWMELFSLEQQVVREAEEMGKILSSDDATRKMGPGVKSFQREVSIFYSLYKILFMTYFIPFLLQVS